MATQQSLTDVQLLGQINASSATSMTLPPATIRAADVRSDTIFAASNVFHIIQKDYAQEGGADAVTADIMLYQPKYSGTLISIPFVAEVAPAGGDKQLSIDVLKSTGTGAFATILTSPLVIDSTNADLTQVFASISGSVTFIAGDVFKTEITASGSTGTQAQGILLSTVSQEQAQ